MNLPQDALIVAALKTLADDIGETLTGNKDALLKVMAGQCIEKVAACLPDGTKAASLSYVGGETRAQVVDEAKLIAWMEANRPGEVVKVIRPDTLKAVLDAATKAGSAVDPATGEAIPGVGFGKKDPFLRTDFKRGNGPGEDGRALVREAWRTGALDVRDLLALPAGGDGDA
jgi:hypothetical protein